MPKKAQSIIDATNESITAAVHLTEADAGAIAILRLLAKRTEIALSDDPEAKFDNVSPSLFLKLLSELGLTPAGRQKLGMQQSTPQPTGALAELRARRAARPPVA